MSKEQAEKRATPQRDPDSSNVVVWHTVRKYWPTALATLVVVLVSTVFYTLGQTKIYEAQATLLFDPSPPKPLGHRVETVVDMGAGSFWDNKEYYETQYHIIRSRRVALEVVKELGLQNDHAFLQNLPEGEQPDTGGVPVEPEAAAEALRRRLNVEPVRDSRLATIKLQDANPERAQRVLSTLVEVYVAQNLENALDSTSNASDWLRGQLDTLKSDLDSSEMDLHRYKKENDILSVQFDAKSNMLSDQIAQISAELTRLKAELQHAASRRSVLDRVDDDDPTKIQSSELIGSPLLTQLRADYHAAVRERDGLLGSNKGTNHPQVAAAQKRLDATRKAILKEIRNVQKAVAGDVQVLAGRVGGLQKMLDDSREQAHELNLLEIEFNRLRRSKENTEKLYSLVLERTKEADLTRMLRVNNIQIIDRPLEPTAAVFPKVPLNLAAGLFGGLLLGVAAAFLRGLMDRTLKVPDDIEHDLSIPFLGLLPQSGRDAVGPRTFGQKRRRRGKQIYEGAMELIVHEEPGSRLAEAARAIRTNLMFMSPDNPHHRLLVTSAGPSEGKTTVACSIAIAMAQAGQRVVLIDCDLRRPRIHRIFGIDGDMGLTTALLDGEVDPVLHATAIPNLSVIPAGPIPPNPAELFHTQRFKQLLDDIASKCDRVIVDSPPIVAVTDPAILSTLVDGTVVVARAFKTRKDLARHAVRSIQDVGGNVAGAVLNAVDFSRMEYKYSTYYYYSNDGYYTSDEPTVDRQPTRHDDPPSTGAHA